MPRRQNGSVSSTVSETRLAHMGWAGLSGLMGLRPRRRCCPHGVLFDSRALVARFDRRLPLVGALPHSRKPRAKRPDFPTDKPHSQVFHHPFLDLGFSDALRCSVRRTFARSTHRPLDPSNSSSFAQSASRSCVSCVPPCVPRSTVRRCLMRRR
jgi:hypothetical protein